jgi:hypothetical protein
MYKDGMTSRAKFSAKRHAATKAILDKHETGHCTDAAAAP